MLEFFAFFVYTATIMPEQPQETPKVAKVEIVRELCIGAGSCIAITPEAFEFDQENIAVLKASWRTHTDEDLIAAAKSCPTLAIRLYDENNHLIYPEE